MCFPSAPSSRATFSSQTESGGGGGGTCALTGRLGVLVTTRAAVAVSIGRGGKSPFTLPPLSTPSSDHTVAVTVLDALMEDCKALGVWAWDWSSGVGGDEDSSGGGVASTLNLEGSGGVGMQENHKSVHSGPVPG